MRGIQIDGKGERDEKQRAFLYQLVEAEVSGERL
jgi:hypothetical protein